MLKKTFISAFIFFLIGMCSTSSEVSLPSEFNNCVVSLDSALDQLKNLKDESNLDFEYRIVREETTRDECIDMVLGTNLEQGSVLSNDSLIDLVVGVKKNEITESVKKSEYELYMEQINELGVNNLNLLDAQLFGNAEISNFFEGVGVISHISKSNSLGYEIVFSIAEGVIYGIKDGILEVLLDISDVTIKESESGLHSFEFIEINSQTHLVITYSDIENNYYYFASYEVINNEIDTNSRKNLAKFETNGNKVHFGGKILKHKEKAILCLGDLNSPGNSAKFDSPWGKVISIDVESAYENTITSVDDKSVDVIAYGFRNPWSCFLNDSSLIIPDVGNSHWEEVNLISEFEQQNEVLFFGWPWIESFFDANYRNEPVSTEIKEQQLKDSIPPSFIFPHANNYCAVIGGTNLESSRKWGEYVFVGDFCTGTIWALNLDENTKLKVLDRDIIPYSITTIQDSGNESLLVGTTSGNIFEILLP